MSLNQWLDSNLSGIVGDLNAQNREFFETERMLGPGGREKVYTILFDLRAALFPGVYERCPMAGHYADLHIGNLIRGAAALLTELAGYAFHTKCTKRECAHPDGDSDAADPICPGCLSRAQEAAMSLVRALPEIRSLLADDIEAAYRGDPAAVHREEIILSYPFMEAVTIHRLAHELYKSGVPVIPRIMSEYAHHRTGIDIHPGARIGRSFFIDHGTGVVIGETCRIGNNVKIYQGVTLGARSFAVNADGTPVKGVKRHPDIEDNVIVYSGASILGGDTVIGHDSVIGGNVFLMKSVPPHSKVFVMAQTPPEPQIRSR